MRVILYKTPNCSACRQTAYVLRKHGVAFEEVQLADNPVKVAEFRKFGHTTAPIVEVYNHRGDLVDTWSGFRHEKLKGLTQ